MHNEFNRVLPKLNEIIDPKNINYPIQIGTSEIF